MATAQADKTLREYYAISSERDLLDKLGCDFYYLSVRDISQNEAFLSIYRGPDLDCTEAERTCPFGIRYRRGSYDWKFGADIIFHGAIDTQHVLPTKTPEGVYQHALETMRILGKNGGYIFAPCNNIQSDTPAENIDAMYNAAKEYGS
jgi:hypothetical protein